MSQHHPALTLGQEAPPLTLHTSEGQEVRLSDVLRSKAAMIVFIRGTW
jgi:peroxiredoxin